MRYFLKALVAAVLLAGLSLAASTATAPGYKNFGVAVYVRAYEVREMKDQKLLEARWSCLLYTSRCV